MGAFKKMMVMPHGVVVCTENFDSLYWSYNCPLQMWPQHENPEDEKSKIVGWRVVNYMPRKERCQDLGEEISPDELKNFCDNAAIILKNLAERFEKLGNREIDIIYYPDET